MPYSIEYSTAALVVLQRLPENIGFQLFDAIDRLAEEPKPESSRVSRSNPRLRFLKVRVEQPLRDGRLVQGSLYRVGYELRAERIVIVVLSVKVAKQR